MKTCRISPSGAGLDGASAVHALPGEPLGKKAVDAAVEVAADAASVLIGPGMRDADSAHDFVHGVLEGLDSDSLIVLDALAITYGVMTAVEGGEHPAERIVVTPNDTEASFLLDDEYDGDDE